jgi:hypothetical protein
VLARIGDRQHRRVFFERVENPRWVEALDAKQVFDSPPATAIDASGQELWTPWPEGEYLVRMAALVPETVVRILLRVASSPNPYVHDIVLQAALKLPLPEAEGLVAPLQNYVAGGTLRDGEQVVALIEKFASQGSRTAALTLAEAAFQPRPSDGPAGDRPRRRDVAVGLDRYWYDELLPRAVAALDAVLGEQVLPTVTRWLELFQESSGDYSPESGSDVSYIWRPAIGKHSQNSRYHELGDSLVEAVRDRALSDVNSGRPLESVLAVLERSGQPLLARIGVHIVAMTAGESDAARSRGFAMLTDNRYLDSDFRHEYAELGQAVLPLLSAEESRTWEALILSGPPLSREELERRASFRLDPDETQDEAVRRYQEVWQLNILGAIGAERLPDTSRARLDELVATYGEPAHPEFPSYSASWSGPNSPVDADELSSLTVAEVRTFLATWQPEGSEPWAHQRKDWLVSSRPSWRAGAASFPKRRSSLRSSTLRMCGLYLPVSPTP